MKKQTAVNIFKTQAAIASALGITASAVSQWPSELDQRTSDEIIGAAVRLKIKLPKKAA